ncbi:antibiotic biosynthesis monooxygenase [Microbacterium caowuchunii]|uniref:Antibiotic biosynthesis monooxygenase n=2 Tax=Microbacterium caowuchunii TaxID=2614638 RepID=A0A5N0TAZ9_9MICO|nr:antibiotic biosynthesis monooxygenase [Microbacterium caowuchunii]
MAGGTPGGPALQHPSGFRPAHERGETMTHVAIVEFRIRPERLEEARGLFARMLETSRAYTGCERLDWLVDRDDPASWTLYEEWSSWEAEQAYRDFRAGAGAVPEMGPLLAGPPRLVRLDPIGTEAS